MYDQLSWASGDTIALIYAITKSKQLFFRCVSENKMLLRAFVFIVFMITRPS